MTNSVLSKLVCAVLSLLIFSLADISHLSAAARKSQANDSRTSVDYWNIYKKARHYTKGGLGLERNYYKARDLYLKIVRGNDSEAKKWAYFQLAKLHTRPPLQDYRKAKSYYQSAIDLGELWSAYYLIQIYGNEARTKANRTRMLKLLNLMRESDSPKLRESARQLSRRYGLANTKE